MVEDRWSDLAGEELRYADHAWQLTGEVEVQGTGEQIAVEAVQTDDVRRRRAILRFARRDPPKSINPGNLGDHFDRLERDGDDHLLVITEDSRTYRYSLLGMSYDRDG